MLPRLTTPLDFFRALPGNVGDISNLVSRAKADATRQLEQLYGDQKSLTPWRRVYTADSIGTRFGHQCTLLWIASQTHTEADVRKAASEALPDMSAFSVDNFGSSKRYYKVFQEASSSPEAASYTKEQQYFIDESLIDFRSRGLDGSDELIEQVSTLSKAISKTSVEFQRNVSEDKRSIVLSAKQLDGTPEAVMRGLTTAEKPANAAADDEGPWYECKTDYPSYFGIMKTCKVRSTRKAVSHMFQNRAHPSNEVVLKELLRLRRETAKVTGFESAAARNLVGCMAKDVATVRSFLDDLVPGLQTKFEKELELLQPYKTAAGVPEGERVADYDMSFLIEAYKSDVLKVSEDVVRQYFPFDETLRGLFRVYQDFFGLQFDEVDISEAKAEGLLYHDTIRVMRLTDTAKGEILGYVVLDLHPREGKYSHACCSNILASYPVDEDGTGSSSSPDKRTPAFAILICNFASPTPDQPALLTHSEVVTFFHEFGHGIHNLFGRGTVPSVGGYSTAKDFVELPSQLLENWMWTKSVLKDVSHHKDTKEPLPDSIIDGLIASRYAFVGHMLLRQLMYGNVSLNLHTAVDDVDPEGEYLVTCTRLNPHVGLNDDVHFTSAFGHLCGYGACYYSYLWSQVYSIEIFERLLAAKPDEKGLRDAEEGRRYAEKILMRGGSGDPMEYMEAYLGKKPTVDAFIRAIGVDPKGT